jgi:hypothetical protein
VTDLGVLIAKRSMSSTSSSSRAPRLDYREGSSAANKLVNGFVNETPRNDRHGVERSVTA